MTRLPELFGLEKTEIYKDKAIAEQLWDLGLRYRGRAEEARIRVENVRLRINSSFNGAMQIEIVANVESIEKRRLSSAEIIAPIPVGGVER